MNARRIHLALVLAGVLASGCRATPAVDPARFEGDIRAFEAADRASPAPPRGLVFVGSSSIRMWNLEESFPGLQALNRGFGGSHIADCVAFVPRIVTPYRPLRVVFYAGDNDIAAGQSAEAVLADWQRFTRAVHAETPDALITFLSIKPSPSRWSFWPEARRANELIRADCVADRRLQFVDVATVLLGPDGRPRPELYVEDQLHLSPAGYKLWTSILEPILRT